jgi:hypothetical protein
LEERIQVQQAYRRRRYDVYSPSRGGGPDDDHGNHNGKALLFLPGALVEHTAYSEVVGRLANIMGFLVVVVSLEPTRMIANQYTYVWVPMIHVLCETLFVTCYYIREEDSLLEAKLRFQDLSF